MKNLFRFGKIYLSCAFVNGMIGGYRHWHHNIYPKLYLPEEKPLFTREILDCVLTMGMTSILNIPPPIFIYSMYQNAQRIEIVWRQLEPQKYRFYYDPL